ncbi:hypothetical protein Lalb_Chr08g0236681 [Lupinus albus]|uniref:Uncharacterized protein n=1 Tax=Lupinus albus TaxID=3870 RepID=A0A6A4Q3U7_LUPAL|nr:hypothetical protein Lalb_Chr08g0236681 [Lupinus albus]
MSRIHGEEGVLLQLHWMNLSSTFHLQLFFTFILLVGDNCISFTFSKPAISSRIIIYFTVKTLVILLAILLLH